MMPLGKLGQGESLIKLLVVAIIAIIAIAIAKSYFRETSKSTQKTVEDIFTPVSQTSARISPLSSGAAGTATPGAGPAGHVPSAGLLP